VITDHRLHGHVLHRGAQSYRLAGQDIGGRVWARPCDRAGRETDERLVVLSPDEWPRLRTLVRL
jgi:hypothetical protein